MTLQHLISEAVALAGNNTCANGHDWESRGGRFCHCSTIWLRFQTVYRCNRCGEYDYGEHGGPGYEECQKCFSEMADLNASCDIDPAFAINQNLKELLLK